MKRYREISEEFYNYTRSNTDNNHIVAVFKNPTSDEWVEIAAEPPHGFAKATVDSNYDIYVWGDFKLFHGEDIPKEKETLYAAFCQWDWNADKFDLFIRGWDEIFDEEKWLDFQIAMQEKHSLLRKVLNDGSIFDKMDNRMLRHR